LTNIQKRCSSN